MKFTVCGQEWFESDTQAQVAAVTVMESLGHEVLVLACACVEGHTCAPQEPTYV